MKVTIQMRDNSRRRRTGDESERDKSLMCIRRIIKIKDLQTQTTPRLTN